MHLFIGRQNLIVGMSVRMVLAMACLLLCADVFGQDTAETWQSQSIKDLRTDEERPFSCAFKIYPTDRIDWVQENLIQSFPITSVEGSLPQEGEGVVTYNLMKEGIPGTVTLERRNGTVFLTLNLGQGNDLGAYCRFEVFTP